jgi:MoxR-like ATPase
MTLPSYQANNIELPAMASWPKSKHCFDQRQRDALLAAEAAGRPLLVRGEPGTGKSQLAHAAAVAAKRLFLPHVVDSRSEASDLLWRFDAVARLADAQVSAHRKMPDTTEIERERFSSSPYVYPGPLWWAFDHNDAQEQLDQSRLAGVAPERPPYAWSVQAGTVLLIDEIDKAESDVPNGLLEALGNGRFSVPLLGRSVNLASNAPPPLVIITTNDERELPPAFMRRCLVLTLTLPAGAELIRHLIERGTLHFPEFAKSHTPVLADAAEMLVNDRVKAESEGIYKPGLAEYLDLIRALDRLGGDPAERIDALRDFTYRKQQVTR